MASKWLKLRLTQWVSHCDIVAENYLYHTEGCDRPALRDLANHVIPSVANQWYDLGLQLLDPKYENELEIIEATDTKNDSKTRCRIMFRIWLSTDKAPSWDKVIAALTLSGKVNVASNIKQLLKPSESLFMVFWLCKIVRSAQLAHCMYS